MAPDASETGPASPDPAAAKRRRRLGFGLAALAGLAGLIGAILSFFPPAAHRPGTQQYRSTHTQILAGTVVNAIKGFYTEYSQYPLRDRFDTNETKLWRTDAAFSGVLMGRDTTLNPRKIEFLPELRRFTAGRYGGLKSTASGDAIVDAWGEFLYVRLDADYSGEQENPDPAGAKRTLAEGVLVFSAGPDKDPSTWVDNVTSWAGRPH